MGTGEDTVNRVAIGIGGQGSSIVNNILRTLKHKTGKAPKNEEFLIIDTDPASGPGICKRMQRNRRAEEDNTQPTG